MRTPPFALSTRMEIFVPAGVLHGVREQVVDNPLDLRCVDCGDDGIRARSDRIAVRGVIRCNMRRETADVRRTKHWAHRTVSEAVEVE